MNTISAKERAKTKEEEAVLNWDYSKREDGYNGGDFDASCWDCAAIPMVLFLFQLVPPGCLLCLSHISLSGS